MRNEDLDNFIGNSGHILTRLTEQAREARAAGASRRSFFAKTAVLAGASAFGASLLQPIAAQAAEDADVPSPDTAVEILNIAATAESLATTFYYNALTSSSLPNVNSVANRNYFQAAVVQEYEHLLILDRIGGAPLATSFYFPDNMFTDESVFFPTASLLEDYFISAYIAAAREFSGAVTHGIKTADPHAIGLAVQIAGIECEHRALLRVAANLNPPNNRIIESALITRVNQAATALGPFLQGGSGYSGPVAMPSRAEIKQISKPYDFSSFPAYKIY